MLGVNPETILQFSTLCAGVKSFVLTTTKLANWIVCGWPGEVTCQKEMCIDYKLFSIFTPFQGGNDYEIYMDERTKGHKVTCPEDTMNQIKELFSIS